MVKSQRKISVNVSALQFSPGFIHAVRDVLEESGLPPESLELELTEGIMMDDSHSTIDALESLKRLGVLSPADDATGVAPDANLVAAIIAMARSLNLELVAEGVETRQQYRFLTEHGAAIIQGYLFSKPVPAKELRPLLRERHFDHMIRQINRDLELAV